MAETTGYMIAGYSVIFGAMALYLISLVLRWKKTRGEWQDIEAQRKDEDRR